MHLFHGWGPVWWWRLFMPCHHNHYHTPGRTGQWKTLFQRNFVKKYLFLVAVRLIIRVVLPRAVGWKFHDFLGLHSTQEYDQHLCVDHACTHIWNQSHLWYFQPKHKRGKFITSSSLSSITLAATFPPHPGVGEFHPPPRVKPIFKPPFWADPACVQFSNMEQTSVMERI